jgi:hypothetical protein
MLNRPAPDASPLLALTEGEICLLGGYLAHASDPPPANTGMWRGWSRLMDIKLNAAIADAFIRLPCGPEPAGRA